MSISAISSKYESIDGRIVRICVVLFFEPKYLFILLNARLIVE